MYPQTSFIQLLKMVPFIFKSIYNMGLCKHCQHVSCSVVDDVISCRNYNGEIVWNVL